MAWKLKKIRVIFDHDGRTEEITISPEKADAVFWTKEFKERHGPWRSEHRTTRRDVPDPWPVEVVRKPRPYADPDAEAEEGGTGGGNPGSDDKCVWVHEPECRLTCINPDE